MIKKKVKVAVHVLLLLLINDVVIAYDIESTFIFYLLIVLIAVLAFLIVDEFDER